MIDIRQEELDKAFVEGALAVESALIKRHFMKTDDLINEASLKVHQIIIDRMGEERSRAIQGDNAREPRA